MEAGGKEEEGVAEGGRDGGVAGLPGTSRRSHSLRSGAGGLRWPGRCCLLLSGQSVSATHTHTEKKIHELLHHLHLLHYYIINCLPSCLLCLLYLGIYVYIQETQ